MEGRIKGRIEIIIEVRIEVKIEVKIIIVRLIKPVKYKEFIRRYYNFV
jgi:hypothetical protein